MSNFEDWKKTAAANTQAAPDGFPEGMLRADVNNSAREMMAAIRRFWEDPEWVNSVKDYSVTFLSASAVKIAGTDATALFQKGRKVRVRSASANNAYAFVSSSSYADPDTTVNLEDFDQTGTPTPVTVVDASTEGIDAYFLGGDEANSHGIGSAAFGGGAGSTVFVVPIANTAAGIQTAVNTAAASGGIVMLGDVTYPISAKIAVPSSVQIWGRGPGQTKLLLDANVDDHVFEIADDAVDVSIFNMTIDGNKGNQTAGATGADSHGLNVLNNPSRIFIDRVQVQNCRGHGIGFTGVDKTPTTQKVYQVNISNCIIDTVGKDGIHFKDPNGRNTGISISDCHIRNFGDSGTAADSAADASGIYIEGMSTLNNIVVEANSTSPHASFDGACLKAAQTDATGSPSLGGLRSQWSNIRIEGAQAGTVGIAGIYLGADHTRVSNVFVNLTGIGTKTPLFITGLGAGAEDGSDCVISDATVLSNASGTTLSKSTSGSPRTTFSNCKFLAGTQALQIGGIESVVSNCTFSDQTGASPALTFAGGANESFATGCSFNGITGDAISLASNDTTVEGCKFKTVSGDGIEVAVAGTTNSILGNRFDSVTGDNIKDLGVATKIGINSPNECSKYVPIAVAQNFSVSDTTGEEVAEWTGVTFPYGGNGVRRYKVSLVLVNEQNLAPTGVTSMYYDCKVHLGAGGTKADSVLIELSNIHTRNGSQTQVEPIIFNDISVVPAAGEKLTVAIWFVSKDTGFSSTVWRSTVSSLPVDNEVQPHGMGLPVYADSSLSGWAQQGGECWRSQLLIELLDEA